jgi:phosphosulfolactate synthase (CoM biosynthesis protein A)
MMQTLPFIPDRPQKPRDSGITMVMDKGLSIREAEDFMSVGSVYTDYFIKRQALFHILEAPFSRPSL